MCDVPSGDGRVGTRSRQVAQCLDGNCFGYYAPALVRRGLNLTPGRPLNGVDKLCPGTFQCQADGLAAVFASSQNRTERIARSRRN
jgi:hypothetical protein